MRRRDVIQIVLARLAGELWSRRQTERKTDEEALRRAARVIEALAYDTGPFAKKKWRRWVKEEC
jgi:hypothetical protein